jgi:hypothetical protein
LRTCRPPPLAVPLANRCRQQKRRLRGSSQPGGHPTRDGVSQHAHKRGHQLLVTRRQRNGLGGAQVGGGRVVVGWGGPSSWMDGAGGRGATRCATRTSHAAVLLNSTQRVLLVQPVATNRNTAP